MYCPKSFGIRVQCDARKRAWEGVWEGASGARSLMQFCFGRFLGRPRDFSPQARINQVFLFFLAFLRSVLK
jgi:hypothetical protein